jgi:biopolymer transport protein ExbD
MTGSTGINFEINVTPFLDVLLVLMVTFLASVNARKTMDVVLPVPCTGLCATDGTPIVLEVAANGDYLINRQRVVSGTLLATLHGVYDARPEKVIQVAGHRDARYQDILTAMDVARSAGVRVVAIPPSSSYSTP